MAVVAFTAYGTNKDCSRTNTYVCDGHGAPPATRTNRYISDGHGGRTECRGHLCPHDPILATAYMEAKRWNYERQHTIRKGRQKGSVTHIQLYISPTEDDHVPADERMEMTQELINRTALKDFPSIFIAHDNTSVGHCHISLCPFSADGSHKLCMNNKMLYDLRREMDRICVEHGYSIVECPELWGDKGYREWFLQIKAQGNITIHPQRDPDHSFKKQENKRARDFLRSKQRQRKSKEEREQYYKDLISSYSPEKDAFFFTSEYLYNSIDPCQPLRIKRITFDGKARSEMELRAASLGVWAYNCGKMLEKKAIPGTETLYRRMETICEKAYEAKRLMDSLDIRTPGELIFHICECGQDIGTLKREIKRQEDILLHIQPIIDAIDKWESEQNRDAFIFLSEHNKSSSAEIMKIKKEHTRALARKESYILLLEERSKEYRKLKTAEKTLNPISNEEAWEAYLKALFTKNRISKTRKVRADDIERVIYELGEVLGIPEDTMNQYLIEAAEVAVRLRHNEENQRKFREYKSRLFKAAQREHQGYQQYAEEMAFIYDLRDMQKTLAGFGLLGFLLLLLIESWADMEESITRFKLEIARWTALVEKLYAVLQHRKCSDVIPYYPEVRNTMNKEQRDAAARIQHMIDEIAEFRKKNESIAQQVVLERNNASKNKNIDFQHCNTP